MSIATYKNLLLEFTPRPITSQREYQRVLDYIEQNMRPTLPKAQGDLINLLSTLAAAYEAKHHPMRDVPPAEMLAHFIDAQSITVADVSRGTGISKQTLSNVLNGRRGISKASALKLGKFFHVSPALFL